MAVWTTSFPPHFRPTPNSLSRHFHPSSRYVEEYFMEDIERELGLNRDRLAELALLLGSDYTEV